MATSHDGGIVGNESTKMVRPESLASWAEFHEVVERF